MPVILIVVYVFRVVVFFLPLGGVGVDVISFVLKIFFVTDDVFVIIPLPDTCGVVFASDATGNGGFERSNNCTNGFWLHPAWG